MSTSANATFVTGQKCKPCSRQQHDKTPLLSKVHLYVREGWPSGLPDNLKPYLNRRQELSTQDNCLMWGNRVVIHQKLRGCMVEELHWGHPGMSRMKSGLDKHRKTDHDRQARSREMHVGQQAIAQNLRQCVPWVAGVIIESLDLFTYLCKWTRTLVTCTHSNINILHSLCSVFTVFSTGWKFHSVSIFTYSYTLLL